MSEKYVELKVNRIALFELMEEMVTRADAFTTLRDHLPEENQKIANRSAEDSYRQCALLVSKFIVESVPPGETIEIGGSDA